MLNEVCLYRLARLRRFHNRQDCERYVCSLAKGYVELLARNHFVHKAADALICKTRMAIEHLVFHQHVRVVKSLLRRQLLKRMTGCVNIEFPLFQDNVELKVVDVGVSIGGNPAVFHLGDGSVAIAQQCLIPVHCINATAAQHSFRFICKHFFRKRADNPGKRIQRMACLCRNRRPLGRRL